MLSKSEISSCWLVPGNRDSCFEQYGSGKRVSATESLLLLKSKTTFQSQTIKRYISINSRSTKTDLFVQSITNDDVLANNIHVSSARSIRYARNFPTVVKTDSASFKEQPDFSGSSLQATYGHLQIQGELQST